jgi:hypothetical protein
MTARLARETRKSILGFLEHIGEATLADIAALLGPEWQERGKNVVLRKTLGRMVKAHVLRKCGRGKYTLSATWHLRGLDNFDLREKNIKAFVIEQCGDAATADIHKAVGSRNLADGGRDYEHQLTHRVLRESPQFTRIAPGRWSLTAEELEHLPLLGRRADHDIQTAWFEGDRGGFATVEEAEAAFFDRVGDAFGDARGNLSLSDVACVPDIGAALRTMGDHVPTIREGAIRDLDAELGSAALRLSPEELAPLIAENIYYGFEQGDVPLHLVATPEFYRGCAALFGVCAAALSRGRVVPVAQSRSEPETTVGK